MKIAFQSELMQNQKQADVMAPDQAFEVLQSRDGDSLFFSLGTDGVLYLTREMASTSTGWNRIDLSGALPAQAGGAAVKATAFAVAQNAETLNVDLALVLATAGGADVLYLCLGHANTDAGWAQGVAWTAVPFDAGTPPSPLTIADVFVMNLPTAGGAVENIFVDVLRSPGNALSLLDRYYITPGATPQWNQRPLAADLSAGSISSCLGQPADQPVPGIYTFGSIAGEQELSFTPQYNDFGSSAPKPARLAVPAGATSIASAVTAAGTTNLFVAGSAGLSVFTPDNQDDGATPVAIVRGQAAGATSIAAATAGGRTAVWGIDPQRSLFYASCAAGSEGDPAAWSTPVPLVAGVEGFAFFLNLDAGNSVLFAHLQGQALVQLTQDPVTTAWTQRSILLPSTAPGDVISYDTFTTHLTVTDDGGVPVPNAALSVTATSPVSVYLNDAYYVLSPTAAVSAAADSTGVLTVVQETQSLSAVSFQVALAGTPGVMAAVNPASGALATLSAVQSGADLSAVQVPKGDGTTRPLVPSGASSGDVDAAARSISQLMKVNAGLPADGSRVPPPSGRLAAAGAPAAPRTWGISFGAGGLEYREGGDTLAAFRQARAASSPAAVGSKAAESSGSALEVAAGDFFRWVAHALDDVEHFVVQEAEGVYHFLATVAGKAYDVLLDCVSAVVGAVEFVLNKIEVFFEDLIRWLGFIFEWDDILRTHAVLKNVFNCYMAKCVAEIGTVRADLQSAFTSVEEYVDSWAGLPDQIPASLRGSTLNGTAASAGTAPGTDTPQGNWGLHHLKSNAPNATTDARPNSGVLIPDLQAVLQPLLDALQREEAVLQSAVDSFRTGVIDRIGELTVEEIIRAVVGIIADALLESVENVLLAAVDVLAALVEGVADALNATIEIPVISWMYRKVAGAHLSLLDATCLVAAIPVTIGAKLVTGSAPFSHDAATSALIAAADFAALQRACNGGAAGDGATPALMKAGAQLDATVSDSVNARLVLATGIAAAVGSVAVSVFGPLKQKYPESKVFPVLNGLSYLLYVAPDIAGQIPDVQKKKKWAVINEVITDLMVVKALVDLGVGLTPQGSAAQDGWNPWSPRIDAAGNILWQVPTTAALFYAENQNPAGILGYVGGTCFDCSGILAPILADDSDPDTQAVTIAATTVLNLAWGSMACGASVLAYKAA